MKKFVKGLLVCGLVTGLLAACGTKTSSCSTSPEPAPCPEPPAPEVKEEWSDFELNMFKLTEIAELPFDFELSLSDYDEDGILYAVSKDELDEDAVEAYADLLDETGKYFEYDAGTSDGISLEVAALGFDTDAEMVQFYRPYNDNDESFYADIVTVGLNKDGCLQVAAVAAYLPYYAYMGPKATNGMGIYTLAFNSAQAGGVVDFYNLLYGDIICSTVGGNFSQTLPTFNAAHPAIEEDVTCGAFLNYGVIAPYFYGNPSSSMFTAEYNVTFIKGIDEATQTVDSYNETEFEAVLDSAMEKMAAETAPLAPEQDWDWGYVDDSETPDPANGVWFYYADLAGHHIEVTYSFEEVNIGGPVNVINVDFAPSSFEIPLRGREIASAIGETINYNATYVTAYEAMGYYISVGLLGPASEEYTQEDAAFDVDYALLDLYLDYDAFIGLDVILGEWAENGDGDLVKSLNFYNNDLDIKVTGAIFVSGQKVSGVDYWTFTVQFQQQTRTAIENNMIAYIYTYTRQAYLAGAITSNEYIAFNSIPNLFDYCETIEEVETLFAQAAGAYAEALGIESLLDILDRVDPADFWDDVEEDFSDAFYDIVDAYAEVELDLENPYYTFRYLLSDMSALYTAIETAVQPIRDGYIALIPALQAQYGIVEENYDADDWADLSADIAAFVAYGFEDCYSSSEIEDELLEFLAYVQDEYLTWDVKYAQLFAELLEEYPDSRESEYEASDWADLQTVLSTGAAALEAATDAASAKVAYETARDDAAAIPTKLDTYKAQAKDLLEAAYDGYNPADYTEEGWEALFTAYSEGMAAIDTATSTEDVDAVEAAAEAAMAEVPTKAEEELAAYKEAKIAYLDDVWSQKTPDDYVDEAAYEAAQAAYEDGIAAIEAATSKDEVDTAYATADAGIAAGLKISA